MLHPCNCHHFFVVGCLHPCNCHHFLVVLPPKSPPGAPWGPQGCPGRPSAFRERPKKEGPPPKSGFWGARADFGISPGPSKNAFWPPKRLLGAFWPPKMEPFSVKIESGSEKVDFGRMCVSTGRHEGFCTFATLNRPRIDPEAIPEATRKTTSEKRRQKSRGSPPKVDFRAPGSILEFRRGLPKSRFGPPRNFKAPKVFDPLGGSLFWA